MARRLRNQHCLCEDEGSIPRLVQWIKNPVLPWLLYRPAVAAPVWPLAQELPYARAVATKRGEKRTKDLNRYFSKENTQMPVST